MSIKFCLFKAFIYIYIFDGEAKEYKLTKDKNEDTPKVCSEAFAPSASMNYMWKNKTLQKQHGIFINKQNQTNPIAHVKITFTPAVFTCKTCQDDTSSITSSNKVNALSQL